VLFFFYILRCADETFYVGHTDDLEDRTALHNAGFAAHYTAQRRPVVLIYSEIRDAGTRVVARASGQTMERKEKSGLGRRRFQDAEVLE
jgi:predicted GIY-YIG superfamily endonuclease